VHFTKGRGGQNGAWTLDAILKDGELLARTRFGVGRGFLNCDKSVCLSEAPMHQLQRIADRRSPYGVGFAKQFVIRSGGGPIFYAYGDRGDAAYEIMRNATEEPNHPIWTCAPFIEQPRAGYSFEWEREWRVAGNLQFSPSQVRFICAPEEHHEDMRHYFSTQNRDRAYPLYRCPLIDLNWELARLQQEVR